MLSQRDAVSLVGDSLFPSFKAEREKLAVVDQWYRGQQPEPWKPPGAGSEYKSLMERSYTPWLNLVVTAVAQALYVEGYGAAGVSDNAPAWQAWQANGWDSRQTSVHRGALAHGVSYATALPGTDDEGNSMPVLRGVSARKMLAVYQDPAEDDWPMYAIRAESQGKGRPWAVRVYDEEAVYFLQVADDDVSFIEWREHGIGVCPVVRYTNMLDLDGRYMGEVEPYISTASRIDQDTFDRLMVQRFGSWQVRYIAGLVMPADDEDAERAAAAKKIQLRQDDVLVAEDPDTKFGTLSASPLDGYIKARESDIRDLAAVSQTPPHALTGAMVNLSAEALAAAEAGLNRKVEERKHSFGESHEQLLRLASTLMGDQDGARDPAAQVRWRDMESRSLSQAADALTKIASEEGLAFPRELLWGKLGMFSDQDIREAKKLRAEGDSMRQLMETLERQAGDAGVA